MFADAGGAAGDGAGAVAGAGPAGAFLVCLAGVLRKK